MNNWQYHHQPLLTAVRMCCLKQLMNTELLPSLSKLEKQCEQYHEYVTVSQRQEQLKRQVVANDYMQTEK